MNKKVLVLLLVVPIIGISAIVGGSLYLFLYTSFPFAMLEDALREQGFEVEGLTGTINSGIEFELLKKADSDGVIEMRGVKVQYSGLYELFENRKLVFENVAVKRMRLAVLRPAHSEPSHPGGKKSGPKQPEGPPNTTVPPSKLEEFPIAEFGIRNVDVRDFEFIHFRSPKPIRIDSMRVSDMKVLINEKKFSLGSFSMQSNFVDMGVKGLALVDKELVMKEPLSGSLKAGVHPILKTDVTFAMKGTFNAADMIGDGSLSVFDQKLSLVYVHKKSATLTAAGWTPADHLGLSLPISDLRLSASASPPEMAMFATELSAGFKLFGKDFVLANGSEQLKTDPGEAGKPASGMPRITFSLLAPGSMRAYHIRGDKVFELLFSPKDLARTVGPATQPWAQLNSIGSLNTQAALADLMFGVPFEQLATEQQGQVALALKNFFDSGISDSPVPLTSLAGADTLQVKRGVATAAAPLACVSPSKRPIQGNYTALDGNGSIHEFDSKRKPLKKLVPAPIPSLKSPGAWAAVDDKQRVYVTIGGRLINVAKGKVHEPPTGLPKLRNSGGVAYDSKRKRVVVFGGVGSNSIYSFEPATAKWTLAANLPSTGFAGLAYDSVRDRFYALRSSNGKPSVDRITVLTGDLRFEREVPLRQPAALRTDVAGWSLTAENGLLVLGGTPRPASRSPAQASTLAAILDTGCGEWIPF